MTEGFPARRTYMASDGDENVIMRLNGNMIELRSALIRDAEAELLNKAPLVAAGIDTFTAAERLAYQFLMHTF